MRVNLTKKEIINSIYMQIGFSKNVVESLLEDFLLILISELIKNKKVKIDQLCERPTIFSKKEIKNIIK